MRIQMTQSHSFDVDGKDDSRITLPAGGVFNVDDVIGEEIIELGKGVDVNANNVPNPTPLVDEADEEQVESNAETTPTAPAGGEQSSTGDVVNSPSGEDVLTSSNDDDEETIVDAEIVKIVDVIKTMSGDDFTNSGHPKIQPLSEKLGFKPTPKQVAAAKKLIAEA